MTRKVTKLFMIFLLLLALFLGVIGIQKFYNSKNNDNDNSQRNSNAIIENIAIKSELENSNTLNLVDTYNTEERIEKYEKTRTVDKVQMTVKEGTLTNKGVTVMIYDDNEYHFAYNEEFFLERKENNKWEKVPYFISEENRSGVLPLFESYGVLPKEENPIEMEQNWERIYGELPQGEYRLIKNVSTYNGEQQSFYVEFVIK